MLKRSDGKFFVDAADTHPGKLEDGPCGDFALTFDAETDSGGLQRRSVELVFTLSIYWTFFRHTRRDNHYYSRTFLQ